jgi:outer membrane lipoprotein-sorting protein
MKIILYLAGLTVLGGLSDIAAPAPAEVLARMDRAAAKFQAMSAKVTLVTHTDVIHENTTESGTILVKKDGKARVQALLEFQEPASAQRVLNLAGRDIRIYFPKIKTVQIWDLGKYLDVAEQSVTLGFGTSGKELAESYEVKVLGEETLSGKPAIRLELTPKSDELKRVITKLELWIPESGDPYPLQEKIFSPSNDYHLWSYSDLKINPPLRGDALKLKLPAGVKTEVMQR